VAPICVMVAGGINNCGHLVTIFAVYAFASR
jgi:hypothetical protein